MGLTHPHAMPGRRRAVSVALAAAVLAAVPVWLAARRGGRASADDTATITAGYRIAGSDGSAQPSGGAAGPGAPGPGAWGPGAPGGGAAGLGAASGPGNGPGPAARNIEPTPQGGGSLEASPPSGPPVSPVASVAATQSDPARRGFVTRAGTGLQLDGFVAVDFKAFRDVVNALGGVQVCLDTPLDDVQYPDYHDGYIKGGIHFPAGCQNVNGEQALQIARSRKAIEPEQATDFGRARRQQTLLNAIRKKANAVNALERAPQLMDALQKNFVSSLDPSDINALYSFTGKLPDTAIGHFGVTQDDLVQRYYMQRGSCADFYADVLCPLDPSFRTMHAFFANLFVDGKVTAEKAPVRVDNASAGIEDLGQRVENLLKPLGFQVETPVRRRVQQASYVYDLSGGRYPKTAQWLATYFGATLVTPGAASPPPGVAPTGDGVVVVLGRDYALRWTGQS